MNLQSQTGIGCPDQRDPTPSRQFGHSQTSRATGFPLFSALELVDLERKNKQRRELLDVSEFARGPNHPRRGRPIWRRRRRQTQHMFFRRSGEVNVDFSLFIFVEFPGSSKT